MTMIIRMMFIIILMMPGAIYVLFAQKPRTKRITPTSNVSIDMASKFKH